MITPEILVEFYKYFYSKRYNILRYSYHDSDDNQKSVNTFLELINKAYDIHTLGLNWLWNYCVYQLMAYDAMDVKPRKGMSHSNMMITFLYAKTSFDRYKKRKIEFDYTFIDSEYPVKFGILQSALFSKIEKKEKDNFDPDRKMRSKFHNTDKGFAICIEYTTLYDPRDTSCILCKNKSNCIKILEANYPNLYKQRINK